MHGPEQAFAACWNSKLSSPIISPPSPPLSIVPVLCPGRGVAVPAVDGSAIIIVRIKLFRSPSGPPTGCAGRGPAPGADLDAGGRTLPGTREIGSLMLFCRRWLSCWDASRNLIPRVTSFQIVRSPRNPTKSSPPRRRVRAATALSTVCVVGVLRKMKDDQSPGVYGANRFLDGGGHHGQLFADGRTGKMMVRSHRCCRS
jgi:hypothetical protein